MVFARFKKDAFKRQPEKSQNEADQIAAECYNRGIKNHLIMDCIFCKIRDRIIAKQFTYEDDEVMVFPDINPFKPVHLLVVPKKHIEDYLEFNDSDLSAKVKLIINKMLVEQKLEDGKGYRVSINGGGAQAVRHVHFHIMGPMSQTES
jgi:histidine triad (HIT) family protein